MDLTVSKLRFGTVGGAERRLSLLGGIEQYKDYIMSTYNHAQWEVKYVRLSDVCQMSEGLEKHFAFTFLKFWCLVCQSNSRIVSS